MVKIGRNDPCPCGSGQKYKKCCLVKEKSQPASIDITSTPVGKKVVVADTDYIKSVFTRLSQSEGQVEQTDPATGKVVLKAAVNMNTGVQQPTWFDWDFWTVRLNGRQITQSEGQAFGDLRWNPETRTIDMRTKSVRKRKR